jgi:hypothetical protein
MLAYNNTSAVMHLQRLNPMLSALLHGHIYRGSMLRAARQDSPELARVVCNSAWQLAHGISSFAFQGTNAHAIAVKGQGQPAGQSVAVTHWQQRRFWFNAPVHMFASRATSSCQVVQVQGLVVRPDTAYLWDHRVRGTALFPGAAMFEAAYNAGRVLTLGQYFGSGRPNIATPALQGISIVAPLRLEEQNGSAMPNSLLIDVEIAVGRMVLRNNISASITKQVAIHLVASYSLVVAVPPVVKAGADATNSFTFLAANNVHKADGRDVQQPSATARVWRRLQLQAQQYHVHPAMIDNATQARYSLLAEFAISRHAPCFLAWQIDL